MPRFSSIDYKEYLKARLDIIVKRSVLCQQIMDPLPPYDYWTYNYAYYLYSLNAEEINTLRYLFGADEISFYEFTTLGHLRKYLCEINWHGIPKNRDYTRNLGTPCMLHSNLYITAPNFGLPVVIPPFIPPAFQPITTELSDLQEQLYHLTDKHPELCIKPSKPV